MYCAKCGLELPDGVKNCPKCGLVNEFVEAPQPPAKNKKLIITSAAIACALLVIAVVAVLAVKAGRGNVTSAPNGVPSPPGNVIAAPPGSPSDGRIMSAPPGNPAPGDTTPGSVAKPKPPQEVEDYLAFVKEVEKHRQMLLDDTTNALTLSAAGGQTQSMLSMIDMAMDPDGKEAQDPLADSKKELTRQYKNWLATLDYFDKKPAPQLCRDFSGSYRAVLYNEAKTIGEITVSFNNVNITDPQDLSKLLSALQKMKKDPTIQQSIDKAADDADGKLTQLVSNYDMKKPFDVPREKQTSGNIMAF